MQRYIWIVMGLWLFSPLICSAEWYKYKDKNGVWHYSDSLTTSVPFEQRTQTEKVKDADDYLSDEERQEKQAREASAKEAEAQAAAEKEKAEKIRNQYQSIASYEALEQKRTELADLHKKMMVQKEKLETEKKKIKTAEDHKKHQALVAEYNRNAKDYQARRKAYEGAVKAYEQKQKQKEKK